MNVHNVCLGVLSFWSLSAYADAINVDLGTGYQFAILAGSTVTSTGATVVHGDLGVAPGTVVTGFPPGIVSGGTIHAGDAVAQQAQIDLTTGYNFAAGQACGTTLTGQDLGGLTLLPGVYCFSSTAQLTGTLSLDTQLELNPVFVFQIGSTLTTADGASVVFVNGGPTNNVYWQVGTSATIGANTEFAGNILASASITLNSGANITRGRALALNAAVTLNTNDISFEQTTGDPVPEPATAALLSMGLLLGLGVRAYGRQAEKLVAATLDRR